MAKGDITKAFIYTTPSWKRQVLADAIAMAEAGNLSIPDLTKKCMQDEELRKKGKETSEFAKKTALDVQRSSDIASKKAMVDLDEESFLKGAAGFLSSELGLEVTVAGADDEGKYDPVNKARVASPGRVAIYLE
jgi:leucyl-tRNA synthetase